MPIKVKLLSPEHAARWDAFVRACPQATFFHLSAWQEIVRTVFRHRTYFLFVERDGQIIAVLPLAEVKSRLFGHALTSLPFCVYGGIAAAADAGFAAGAGAVRYETVGAKDMLEDGKTVGDVAPELYGRDDLTITPAKGGVGPLTVCALFDNVIRAARQKTKS